MNGREFALICCIGCCVIAFLSFLAARQRRASDVRLRRFDLLVEALRDPGLDAATRAELLRAVAREHVGVFGWIWQRLQSPMLWRVLWFGTGWLTMLLSGAALLTHALGMGMVRSYDLPQLVMTAALGFGMLTLPLALRELTRRQQVSSSR